MQTELLIKKMVNTFRILNLMWSQGEQDREVLPFFVLNEIVSMPLMHYKFSMLRA